METMSFKVDSLRVSVYETAKEMGGAAADYVAGLLQSAIDERGSANLILATGASQFGFLEALRDRPLDWGHITVFHLDEYRGISDRHPASFRRYLRERILDEVKPGRIFFLEGDAPDLGRVIEEYEEQLRQHPIDVACIGIGENGHIAFNDPPFADFNDPHLVRIVQLAEASRRQQLGEGWFSSLEDVPSEALSLTIPAIMQCRAISCVVPDKRKASAVRDTLLRQISAACPATILRTHPNVTVWTDRLAASKIGHMG